MSKDDSDNGPPQKVFFSHDMLRGVPLVFFSKFALFFIQFSISVVIVRILGKEEFGLLSACQAIGELMLVICGLGLNTALVRFTPELSSQRNRAGIVRLLVRTAAIQAVMVVLATAALWLLKPHFDERYFKFDSQYLLLLIPLLVSIRLARKLVEDSFTSFFLVGTVALLSFLQSVAWLILALVFLERFPTASTGIAAQAAAAAIFPAIGGVLLIAYLRRLNWKSPPYGIGRRRVLKLSFASLLNALGLMILQQYSVVFFLAVFFTPAVAGVYRLGCETPLLAIAFIPLAMRKLLVAGFAEAYAKDEDCLGVLIAAVYRALILVVMPIVCFGVFFVSRGIVLIYREDMAEAGPVATLFCMIHALSLISMPLSMAIVAKEKVLNMAPMIALQVVVNLVLDVVLIPPFGIYGGVAAVFLTFALTIPIRLYVVSRIIGGIYFPLRFLARVTIPLTVIAGLLSPLAPYLNIFTFFALGGAYLAFFPVLVRLLGLLREEEIAELRAMDIPRLDQFLNFLTGK